MWHPSFLPDPFEPEYQSHGLVTITPALQDDVADALAENIEAARGEFKLLMRNGVLPKPAFLPDTLSPKKQHVLREQLDTARKHGLFTYLYRFWENPEQAGGVVAQVISFLKSPACWAAITAITGVSVRACQVAGVTRYGQGHYLGEHSDRISKLGYQRKVAFALYLNRHWEDHMGGMLTHIYPDGSQRTFLPSWNALVLMDIEALYKHYVSEVTAPVAERITIPGFFCE